MANKYEFKKTLLKAVEIFVYGGIGALISYLTKLEPTSTVVATIAVLKAIQNYLKHRNQ